MDGPRVFSATGEAIQSGDIMPRRYLAPFAFLALLPLGGWLGGAWTFLAAIATPLFLVGLDAALGNEAASSEALAARWLPTTYVVLQLAATAGAAAWVSRPSTNLLEFIGMTASAGVTAGVFGFVAAHELIHSRDGRERALGLTFLASAFYMHFAIAHIYGHHRRAGTREDPATARLGEGLYAFLVRSVVGQFREAWAFEARRRQRAGSANRVIAYLAIEALFLIALALVSWRILALAIAVAVIAVMLLESFNYIAHYGLVREARAEGRAEPLAPHHSWNSGRRMNNASLFNMGRHSDHHRRTTHPYDRLEPLFGSAELPSGYAAALLTALVPPLWRRVMDPRVAVVRLRGTGR